MPRHFARKFQTHSAVALFVAILSFPAVFATPATAQHPVPFIDQPLVPDATAPGGPTFTLTVNGGGFVAASTVNWNGASIATTFISSAKLTATVPASDIATASTASVTVVNPKPGGGASNPQFFSIAAPGAAQGGNPMFLAPMEFSSAGDWGWSIAVADLNGDGKPDVVVTNSYGSNNIGVLLGNGDGTLQPVVTYNPGAGPSPVSVAIADVNGDGKLDLVVSNVDYLGGVHSTPGYVGILLGNGDGTFQPVVNYYSGAYQASIVAVADVNGDGKPDLVVTMGCVGNLCYETGSVGVLLGNGDGTFQPVVTYETGASPAYSAAVADLNGDGKLDLVVANCCDQYASVESSIGVLLGNGDGTFQPVVNYETGTSPTYSVAVADVNGDSKPDLIVGNGQCAGCATGDGSIGILLGNGDGTFQPLVAYDAGAPGATSIVTADVYGNGALDVLYATGGSLGILPGNGDGTFQPAVFDGIAGGVSELGGENSALAVADMNGDGRPDMVAALEICFGLLCTGEIPGGVGVALDNTGPHFSTTTTLTLSPNPALFRKKVTYTATVTSQSGGAVAGTVTFQDGGTTIATLALSKNLAAYSTSYKVSGLHPITALYSGDLQNSVSTSSTVTEDIQDPSRTKLTTSGSPSLFGRPVTFTATVTANRKFGAIPNGELVTFYDGKTAIGTGTTAGGVATFTTSSLTAKTHHIKATYAGDDTFEASSGDVEQVVNN